MSERKPKQDKQPRPGKSKTDPHQNEMLDEALDETFPASDPPAMTQPKTGRD